MKKTFFKILWLLLSVLAIGLLLPVADWTFEMTKGYGPGVLIATLVFTIGVWWVYKRVTGGSLFESERKNWPPEG